MSKDGENKGRQCFGVSLDEPAAWLDAAGYGVSCGARKGAKTHPWPPVAESGNFWPYLPKVIAPFPLLDHDFTAAQHSNDVGLEDIRGVVDPEHRRCLGRHLLLVDCAVHALEPVNLQNLRNLVNLQRCYRPEGEKWP